MKNPNLQSLIVELKKTSIENNAKVWKRIALELEKPLRNRRVVNLSKINKVIRNNEIAVVPGKVLSMGYLDKKVTIAAYKFSQQALEKIKSSGSEAITISELVKKNPKGLRIRIIG